MRNNDSKTDVVAECNEVDKGYVALATNKQQMKTLKQGYMLYTNGKRN